MPALDIAVRSQEHNGGWVSCIQPNDWETLVDEDLLARIAPLVGHNEACLAPVTRDDGRLLGRCALGSHFENGALTVNGIFAGEFEFLVGMLIAENNSNLARSEARPIAGIREMADWANRQRHWVSADDRWSLLLSSVLLRLGASPGELPLTSRFEQYLDQAACGELARTHGEIWLVDRMSSFDKDVDEDFTPAEFQEGDWAWTYCVDVNSGWIEVLGTSFLENQPAWPAAEGELKPLRRENVLIAAVEAVWGGIEIDEPDDPQVVGKLNGKPVYREVKILRKPAEAG